MVDEELGPVTDILATFDFRTEQEFTKTFQNECQKFTESRLVSSPRDAERLILSTLKDDANDLLILGLQRHDSLGIAQRNSRTFQLIARASTPVLTITDKVFR